MSEIVDQISEAHRAVRAGGGGAGEDDGASRTVLLRRAFPAPVEDVWDACTTAERIGRWLMPVSGDLRLGGRYQLQGNAVAGRPSWNWSTPRPSILRCGIATGRARWASDGIWRCSGCSCT